MKTRLLIFSTAIALSHAASAGFFSGWSQVPPLGYGKRHQAKSQATTSAVLAGIGDSGRAKVRPTYRVTAR